MTDREMTLQEWCETLPGIHRVNRELAQLREALRDAVSLIDPLMETTDEPYTEWDAVAITFLDTAKALTEATGPKEGE